MNATDATDAKDKPKLQLTINPTAVRVRLRLRLRLTLTLIVFIGLVGLTSSRKLLKPVKSVKSVEIKDSPSVTKQSLPSEYFDWKGCISRYEAAALLQARASLPEGVDQFIEGLSLDLGKTHQGAYVSSKGVGYSQTDPLLATWEEISEIAEKEKQSCFALYDDGSQPWKISTLSKKTGNPASLCAPLERTGAPTLVLGGFTMHRISGENVNPTADTAAKIDSIPIINSNPQCNVLDTCMGLGYTTILAAQRVPRGRVTTLEFDDASLEMSAFNPWSQGLFDGSLPIDVLTGNACELILTFPEGGFDAVIHDPPARALCNTDLYGLLFYKELYRVLKPNGQLFHYIGNPASKESGRLYKGIVKRLEEAGFQNVQKEVDAFGLVAGKR